MTGPVILNLALVKAMPAVRQARACGLSLWLVPGLADLRSATARNTGGSPEMVWRRGLPAALGV